MAFAQQGVDLEKLKAETDKVDWQRVAIEEEEEEQDLLGPAMPGQVPPFLTPAPSCMQLLAPRQRRRAAPVGSAQMPPVAAGTFPLWSVRWLVRVCGTRTRHRLLGFGV